MKSDIDKILGIMDEINAIPRQSHNLEKIHPWLMQWGRQRGFAVETDQAMNILIKVPAVSGYEKAPTIVLQGHMDMVCEKRAGSSHDFKSDPILSWRDGDWLRAKETSLGADNAIALAMFFALVTEENAQHPELEILITADEETGLIGAQSLNEGFLRGRVLLNLDSEEEGVFTIGCSGGMDFNLTLPLGHEPIPSGYVMAEVQVGGLEGGHSGIDIHIGRASANVLLPRVLTSLLDSIPEIRLCQLSGGTAHNAIARESVASLAFPKGREAELTRLAKDLEATLKREYGPLEPRLFISINLIDSHQKESIKTKDGVRLLDALRLIPHGVRHLSTELDGIVDTSMNFANLHTEVSKAHVRTNIRSTQMSRGTDLAAVLKGLAHLYGGSYQSGNPYPSWEPRYDSPLLEHSKKIWKEVSGEEAGVEVTHAGLECGAIGARFPGMDMISFGPTIKQPHSPDERLFIPSVGRVYTFLKAVVRSFRHSP